MRFTCFGWGGVLSGLVLGFLFVASAGAQPLEVSNLEDSGSGSLREAIQTANASPGPDEIIFTEGLTGTIDLLTALPAVTENLDIRAREEQSIIIRGPSSLESFIEVSAGTTEVLDVDLERGQISIGLNNIFTFNQTRDAEFNQTITDGGKLRKEGGASLTLRGTNDYTGGTEVAAGELIGDSESLQGLITNDAELVFDQSATGTFNGTIEGTGNVTKRGTGELTFIGSNNYGGATTVSNGTLIGNPTNIKNNVSVDRDATLDVTTDEEGTMSISGAGTLIKRGSDKLNLTGNSSVANATVESGTISGEAAAIPDDLMIMPNTTVIFDQQTQAGTHQGAITGFGSVQKDGPESLTLLGNNNYSGRTTVNMGELIGNTNSLPGNITNNAKLVFDQSTDGIYENEIDGTGDFEKRGFGTLGIRQSLVAGSTAITDGELSLLETSTRLVATAIVNVGANGTLSGNGTVASNVVVQGRLSPGTSVGNLIVTEEVTFESGSVFEVEVEVGASDENDLLTVLGDLTIGAGAGLEIIVNPGKFEPGEPKSFEIATAANDPDQNNLEILTSFAFLNSTLDDSGPTNLILTLTRNEKTLADFAQTPNELAVAEGLSPPLTGNAAFESDFETVDEALTTLSQEEIPSALNAIGGEQLAPFATQRLAIARRFHQAVDSRMNTLYWRDWETFTGNRQTAFAGNTRTGPVSASAPGALPAGAMGAALTGTPASSFDYTPRESQLGGWIDAFGVLGSLDGNGNASTVDYQIGGGTIAMDYRFLDHYLVGLAGGYAHTSTELNGLPRDGVANTGQVGVYLGRVTPLYYVDVAGRFGYSSIETNRKIAFGQLNRTAKASFDGLSYGAHVSGGLNVADLVGIVFQPVAGFDYVRLHHESISEKGAGSLNLSVPSENLDSIVTQLGARLFGEFEIADGLWFLPNLDVRWMHEFGDTHRAIDARLSGATTGGAWGVSSVGWPRDTAVIGVGWTITTRNRFQIYIDYDATVGSGVLENGFGGGARIVW